MAAHPRWKDAIDAALNTNKISNTFSIRSQGHDDHDSTAQRVATVAEFVAQDKAPSLPLILAHTHQRDLSQLKNWVRGAAPVIIKWHITDVSQSFELTCNLSLLTSQGLQRDPDAEAQPPYWFDAFKILDCSGFSWDVKRTEIYNALEAPKPALKDFFLLVLDPYEVRCKDASAVTTFTRETLSDGAPKHSWLERQGPPVAETLSRQTTPPTNSTKPKVCKTPSTTRTIPAHETPVGAQIISAFERFSPAKTPSKSKVDAPTLADPFPVSPSVRTPKSAARPSDAYQIRSIERNLFPDDFPVDDALGSDNDMPARRPVKRAKSGDDDMDVPRSPSSSPTPKNLRLSDGSKLPKSSRRGPSAAGLEIRRSPRTSQSSSLGSSSARATPALGAPSTDVEMHDDDDIWANFEPPASSLPAGFSQPRDDTPPITQQRPGCGSPIPISDEEDDVVPPPVAVTAKEKGKARARMASPAPALSGRVAQAVQATVHATVQMVTRAGARSMASSSTTRCATPTAAGSGPRQQVTTPAATAKATVPQTEPPPKSKKMAEKPAKASATPTVAKGKGKGKGKEASVPQQNTLFNHFNLAKQSAVVITKKSTKAESSTSKSLSKLGGADADAMDVDDETNKDGVVNLDSDSDWAAPVPRAPVKSGKSSGASTAASASASCTSHRAAMPPPVSINAGPAVAKRPPAKPLGAAASASSTSVDTQPPSPLFEQGRTSTMSSMSSIGSGLQMKMSSRASSSGSNAAASASTPASTSSSSGRLVPAGRAEAIALNAPEEALEPGCVFLSTNYLTTNSLPSLSEIFDTIADDLTRVSIVAHNKAVQDEMDRLKLAWGTQLELARGVTNNLWDWSKVRTKLLQEPEKFLGSNADAAWKVASVMLDRAIPNKQDFGLWLEYDREQVAIEENLGRGNGLMGDHMGEPAWHGGKIQQLFSLYSVEPSSRDGPAASTRAASDVELRLRIEKSEMRRSHYFARALGSRRIFQVRVPESLIGTHFAKVKAFVTQPLVLLGRVYMPFHAKEADSIYYVETSKDWERKAQEWGGDRFRMSYRQIIDWHNPMEYNHNQAIAKWSTRNTIGFSNTIPAAEFDEENMFLLDDIYCAGYNPRRKAEAHEIMTDGCGLINLTAMKQIRNAIGVPFIPSAVQGRIAGAKGVWILHPTDRDSNSPARIWIRKSQNKIILKGLDRAHRIFNLLGPSRHTGRSSLSLQSILNLSHNGVPNEVFVELLEEGLKEDIAPLFNWNEMECLWNAIASVGNVVGARAQRILGEAGRAKGLQGRSFEKETILDEAPAGEDPAESDNAVKSGWTARNELSGQPIGVFEAGLEMLQAGNHPKTCKPLWNTVRSAVKLQVEKTTETPKLPVNQSTTAMIVPDPTGTLKKGEVYFRPSESMLEPETGLRMSVLIGLVLVGRYPLRLECDIQKWKAVDVAALSSYYDVLIVSTEDYRSAANYLSGGDYDGDEVFIIWDKRLVEPFQNKPFVSEPPNFIEKYFERNTDATKSVKDYCQALKWGSTGLGPQARKSSYGKLYEVMLLSVSETRFGLYSKFHDNAVWAHGLDHSESICLGYIFTTLLDASKTGLAVKDKVFRKHSSKYSGPHAWTEEARQSGFTLKQDAGRPKEFVVNCILRAGKAQRDKFLHEFEQIPVSHDVVDLALTSPYDEFCKYAEEKVGEDDETAAVRAQWSKELIVLRAHVKRCMEKWSESFNEVPVVLHPVTGRNKKGKQVGKPKDDPVGRLVSEFWAFPEGIRTLRHCCCLGPISASYAYKHKQQFAYAMAYRDLCLIKAAASPGGIAACGLKFDMVKSISSSMCRALMRQAEGQDL